MPLPILPFKNKSEESIGDDFNVRNGLLLSGNTNERHQRCTKQSK